MKPLNDIILIFFIPKPKQNNNKNFTVTIIQVVLTLEMYT